MTTPHRRWEQSSIDRRVGQRIKHRREAMGVSQGRLGAYLGVTFSQVQKYEKGTNRIGAGSLFMIARRLNVDVASLFEGLDNPKIIENEITPRVSFLAEKLATLPEAQVSAIEALVMSMGEAS